MYTLFTGKQTVLCCDEKVSSSVLRHEDLAINHAIHTIRLLVYDFLAYTLKGVYLQCFAREEITLTMTGLQIIGGSLTTAHSMLFNSSCKDGYAIAFHIICLLVRNLLAYYVLCTNRLHWNWALEACSKKCMVMVVLCNTICNTQQATIPRKEL